MDTTWVGMTWLHALGMVGLLGYYASLALVVLPSLGRSLDGAAMARAVAAIGHRSRPMLVVTAVLFLVSGIYLLVSAGRYAGAGNLFATTWTTMLTVKHLLVLVMLALGVAVDRLGVAVGSAGSEDERRTLAGVLGLATEGMTALGALILVLTAVAQAS